MKQRMDFYAADAGVYQAMVGLEKQVEKSGIEKSLAELVRMRASQINGCAYCLDMHAADARQGGENVRRLDTLSAWRETPFFTDRERAALAWTESLTLVAETRVPDEVWEQVRVHFSEAELANLTLLVVAINGWNRFAVSFRKMPE